MRSPRPTGARAMALRPAALVLALGAATLACTGAEPRKTAAADDGPSPSPALSAAEPGSSTPGSSPQQKPASGARVVLRVEEVPHGLALVVENHGPGSVSLGTSVVVRVDGKLAAPLSLRSGCAEPPPACRTLLEGAALTPPVWLGGQCTDPVLGARPEGDHTFEVRACGAPTTAPPLAVVTWSR